MESVRDVLQERVYFTVWCEVIPLKLELGTISKPFLSVPSGKGELKVGRFYAINKASLAEKNTAVGIHILQCK